MLLQRQLSLASLIIAAAFALPEAWDMLRHPSLEPTGFYTMGGLMATLAVLFGCQVALAAAKRGLRYLQLGFWLLVALCFLGLMQLGAIASQNSLQEFVCYASGGLPLLVFALMLIQAGLEDRRKKPTEPPAA